MPNIGATKYIKQLTRDLKGEIESKTIIADFYTPLTSMDRLSRVNKKNNSLK